MHQKLSSRNMRHFQDIFDEKIRLSELRDNYLGHDKFVESFGMPFVRFAPYYKDGDSRKSVILGGTDNKREWENRINEFIKAYGDIRVCYIKDDRRAGEKREFECMTKKDLVDSLSDVPDDAEILEYSLCRIKGYTYNKDRNIIIFL